MPKSRRDFWEPKIARNKARDREVRRILRKCGWKVLRFWEHALDAPAKILATLHSELASGMKRH